MNPQDKYSICTYIIFSYKSIISSWISIKFAAGILPIYALPVKQLSAKSKHLNVFLKEVSTLLVDYFHNMDPK